MTHPSNATIEPGLIPNWIQENLSSSLIDFLRNSGPANLINAVKTLRVDQPKLSLRDAIDIAKYIYATQTKKLARELMISAPVDDPVALDEFDRAIEVLKAAGISFVIRGE